MREHVKAIEHECEKCGKYMYVIDPDNYVYKRLYKQSYKWFCSWSCYRFHQRNRKVRKYRRMQHED